MLRAINGLLATACLLLPLGAAQAAVGDVHRVTGERVNLRAGPSDDANVRGQLLQDEQLLELQRAGGWLGVRVLRTGEEGWVFGDLVGPVSSSSLGAGMPALPVAPGLAELSRDLDRLLASVSERRGVPLFTRLRQPGNDTLEATLSEPWLRAGSGDEHLMAATALYEMWKNHQNGRPVRVLLLDPAGKRYITIDDTASQPGALLTVAGG